MGHVVQDLLLRLEQLNEVGVALSKERDLSRLLEQILLAAKNICRADGGTLYRVTEDGSALRCELLRTDSLHMAMGGSAQRVVDFPDLPLHTPDGAANDALVATYTALHERTVNIADAYMDPQFDFSGTRRFDERFGYRTQSVLAVPLRDHEGDVIGVLQLINALQGQGGVGMFSAADQSLAESLASQAAIALTNRKLLQQLENLFESFINLINLAIDEKSRYTGGHCQRVPVLAMMLAEAVNAATDGPLADFRMSDKDRYELKIAGLLHDCGKITTPVHVVDKATKLQTLFDRIELVDTRFEVVKRDAEIAALRAQLACVDPTGQAVQAARQVIEQSHRQIEEDRQFLHGVNQGAERMADADLDRVRQIATAYTWCDTHGMSQAFLSTDELENLTIRAGTLTAAERDIINHHIVSTIQMLEQLPWPKNLKNVPEYAGGHHERMDGKGYPKGLTREQMSVQARIMGVADIFEALTASDRPYKQGMTLSQAMGIMHRFARTGHIDPDLFEIFVRHQVYMPYAQQFLHASQIDAVDADALLS